MFAFVVLSVGVLAGVGAVAAPAAQAAADQYTYVAGSTQANCQSAVDKKLWALKAMGYSAQVSTPCHAAGVTAAALWVSFIRYHN
ncbi:MULTISPECIES: hypothetical protein [unclassified Paenarthrobacter]|uniref:hypothetical protein n=1 Tax=unclassified Paenarthrobacter TaxID=2634190 RepID=UPI00214777BC|nr:hypothetical protein [Paenarthrobacter sp. UW852]MCR1163433.1 hypothetical protein [Paenarthrobacter sp. UW852]